MKFVSIWILFHAAGLASSLNGADSGLPSFQNKDASEGNAAKIIAVDLQNKTLLLQAQNTRRLFYLNQNLSDAKTHGPFAVNQLAQGQYISFISRPRQDGQLEIVSMVILGHGSGSGAGGGSRGGPVEVSPFR